ncbi:MAG: hypothetical protein WBM71_11070 [Sedimenticolaceae bacterium]
MTSRRTFIRGTLGAVVFIAGSGLALAGGGSDDAGYCMEVDIEPFHMVPGFATAEGACAVRDYWDGDLQDAFYPFTKEDHLFNCEYFGDLAPLPTGEMVPSSVVSEGQINGTIGGHPFSATLFCASLTNWYQDSCTDPEDPMSCGYQLAQPFLNLIDRNAYPRVTEVSVFDGAITVARGRKTVDVPLVMATRAAGITHLENPDPDATQVGASVTHSLLGMLTYSGKHGDDVEVLDGSLDLLLQGHIFFPNTVKNDPGAARIKGTICSRDLYKLLNKPKRGGKGKKHGHHDDD